MANNSCMVAGKLFQECSFLLAYPLNIRKESDIESKPLLTHWVLFGTNLQYGKISGIGTGDIPVIYSDLAMSDTTNSYLVELPADISNEIVEYICTIDARQSVSLFKTYVEITGNEDLIDSALSKEEKRLYKTV